MDSPQSVVSSFKNSIVPDHEKQQPDVFIGDSISSCMTKEIEFNNCREPDSYMGFLQVYIHQARDIHNICIYHKQDVYAKLCLTSDPDNSVSSKIINGGGRNPVFNDSVELKVRKVDCSVKCEIWMMSRVRNYLEDQLLGFALVPLSEVILKNGKLEKEFSLSSTDLFHSPAGFVQLSLSYAGSSPEVMDITAPLTATETVESLPSEMDKIEFPDPKIVNENEMMVSEYFRIPNDSLVAAASDSSENEVDSDDVGEKLQKKTAVESVELPKIDSPPSSVSTNGVSSPSAHASSQPSDAPVTVKSKTEKGHNPQTESESSVTKPMVTVNLEVEQKVVQQDFVDMYMKSMQQFTESLAKMKLPLDVAETTETTSSGNSSSNLKTQQTQTPKSNGSRVFYGSRAFF